ncbi:bon1-associated protein 2 [Phtheirospermum japonicum]|uniref:Bon1-associated protein 2 n=1 Tax=Phtheirospermum japonicum TaxID=374723 RepID=A0A830BG42_9LAMI|nr:bon1-associated protein 2 [Phtheirospermum japonicum]
MLFSRRIRPFITLTSASNTTATTRKHVKIYKTRMDDKGGVNPTWGDKFRLPFDQFLVNQRYQGVYLHLYTKHLLMGKTQLGWCLIPATDIVNQFSQVGSTQFLSYRLRARDGSRGNGIVNVAVRLEGSVGILHPPRSNQRLLIPNNVTNLQETHESDGSVIGIPIKAEHFLPRK